MSKNEKEEKKKEKGTKEGTGGMRNAAKELQKARENVSPRNSYTSLLHFPH
jgi:hypothetical protein